MGGWGLGAGGLQSVPRSNTLRIVPICRRFDCIRCSVRVGFPYTTFTWEVMHVTSGHSPPLGRRIR